MLLHTDETLMSEYCQLSETGNMKSPGSVSCSL